MAGQSRLASFDGTCSKLCSRCNPSNYALVFPIDHFAHVAMSEIFHAYCFRLHEGNCASTSICGLHLSTILISYRIIRCFWVAAFFTDRKKDAGAISFASRRLSPQKGFIPFFLSLHRTQYPRCSFPASLYFSLCSNYYPQERQPLMGPACTSAASKIPMLCELAIGPIVPFMKPNSNGIEPDA